MKIVIPYTNPFPYGDANANRLISYAKELVHLGIEVEVHALQPSVRPSDLVNDKIPKPDVEGYYEGIHYIHTSGSTFWPETGKGKLAKEWIRLKSYAGSARRISKEKNKISLVQLCVANTFSFYFFWSISKRLGLKFIVERGELPYFVKHAERVTGPIKKLFAWFTKKSYGFFDGWILETQNLVDYYKTVAKRGAKYCIVPMTVEEDRFVCLSKRETELGRYVGYCGNMREDDGVSILIRSFAKIASKYPDVKLALAGSSPDVQAQKKLVEHLNIVRQVVFLGRLSRDEVPQFITDAEVLALASPLSIRASATMPCKVGEYMCTGNPVVVTGQGEVFKYLRDGDNSYLATPDSVDDFASKMDYVLSHPEEARAVGERGRQSAVVDFGSAAQAKRIAVFYKSLL